MARGWFTDYPDSEYNFMTRLSQLTTVEIQRTAYGDPEHLVLTLDDPRLFEFPFLFMSDVGTIGINDVEAENLRHYLLAGGFLYVDDFWGPAAWDHWSRQIGRVLPPGDYPIVDIPVTHPIFRTFFTVDEVPQISLDPVLEHDGRGRYLGARFELGRAPLSRHLRRERTAPGCDDP